MTTPQAICSASIATKESVVFWSLDNRSSTKRVDVHFFKDFIAGDQLSCIVHGVKIKNNILIGDTKIQCGRNFFSLCLKKLALTLRSPRIDINIDHCVRTRLLRGDQIQFDHK
ncbi:hypothetical protein AB6A40_009146 [Gnathostoma spinigerum]|uniref:Uncharacterized protein n=1 Tax=Gnathostoma spinigerum TaxID=75299 RepID=A0ABD6ETI1_9BILA